MIAIECAHLRMLDAEGGLSELHLERICDLAQYTVSLLLRCLL